MLDFSWNWDTRYMYCYQLLSVCFSLSTIIIFDRMKFGTSLKSFLKSPRSRSLTGHCTVVPNPSPGAFPPDPRVGYWSCGLINVLLFFVDSPGAWFCCQLEMFELCWLLFHCKMLYYFVVFMRFVLFCFMFFIRCGWWGWGEYISELIYQSRSCPGFCFHAGRR